MKKLLKIVFRLLSRLIPTGKVLLFNSFPEYADNPYAFFQYIERTGCFADYRKVWLVNGADKRAVKAKIRREHPHTTVTTHTLTNWWYLFRARFVFSSHGFYNWAHLVQTDKRINLWHGMPLKKISGDGGEVLNADRIVVTNEAFRRIMAEVCHIAPENAWIVGQPRNDLLFEPTDFFERRGIDRAAFRSVGIWLPTFRRHYDSDTVDGAFSDDTVVGFTLDQLTELDQFLQADNSLLILKLHPFDALQYRSFPDYKNLLVVKPQEFDGQLYPLLGATDYLLTDYSSVLIDYDVLRRPMGFVFNDFEQYDETRGFNFPDMRQMLPGPVITDMAALQAFIGNSHKAAADTGTRFNVYKDNHSCERLAEKLRELMGKASSDGLVGSST